jgi:hypothetical protein
MAELPGPIPKFSIIEAPVALEAVSGAKDKEFNASGG